MTYEVKPKKRRNPLAKALFATDIDYGKFQDAINQTAMKKAKIRYSKALKHSFSDKEKHFQWFPDKEKEQEFIDAARGLREIEDKFKQSRTNAKNAAEPRKKKPNPTIEEVITYKEDFYKKYDQYHGWKKAANINFNITNKTLNKIYNI